MGFYAVTHWFPASCVVVQKTENLFSENETENRKLPKEFLSKFSKAEYEGY